MSFIQSICGPATSNEFVFSTSNVSSDNASFINLSVLGDATIVTLSTTNFSPTTLDAQVLTAVNGTIATFQSTSSYISNLSVSSMSVDNLSVGEVDITLLDVETIEVDTLKIMDTVNSNYGQVVRASDVMTIAGGYVDPLDPLVTYPGEINLTSGAPGGNRAINISLDKANISGNVIDAITTNSVSVNASDLYSDSVIAIDVDADEGNFGVVNTPFLNVSTLGVSDVVTENISVINASVNNLSVYNTLDIKDRDGSNHHGSIYNDSTGLHIAGNGELIRIRSGGAFDEIVVTKTSGRVNISNLNVSQMTGIDVTLTGTMDSTTVIANDVNTPLLNVSNISVDEDISCEQIVCADVICNDVTTNFLFDVDLTNNLSAGQGITITSVDGEAVISATTSITDPLNISKLNASNISVDVNVSVGGSLTCDGNISVGLQYTQEIIFMNAAMTTQNSQLISGVNQDTYNLLTQDYSIQGNPGIKYLFCDHSLGNTNISNLSCDTVSVAGSFTCNDAQIDDLFNCDMTNTLRGGTSGLDIPFDNISVEFATGTQDTIVMLKPDIVLYNISLLPNILTLAPPTFEMTTGTAQITNANMSNLSVNNLSVLTDITTPSATITDLTIPASGTLNHDFSKNFTAGTGISITHVGNQVTIAATGGVTDPLNLSKLNVSNISVDEGITTNTITCDLTPNLTVGANMSILSVNNKPLIGLNPDINISNLSTVNTSTTNISVLESITVGTGGVGGGIYARNGTGVFSTGGFYFNNKPDGTGGNLNVFWIGGNISAYGIGTLDGHDVRLANGYNTGGLVVDGTINNINMSNCSINNLSLDTLTCDLTPNLTAGTGITITSVGGKPTITATGGGGVTDPLNISKLNVSNISCDEGITTDTITCDLTPNLTAGTNITITSVGGKPVISASGGGVTDPLNISQLNASNISVDEDVTITRDLNVQRYLDSGRPRFMMLARTNDLALTGAGERGATFNTNSTGQVAGEFGVANGGEIQVTTGGWYRVSWAIGFVLVSSGSRYSFRTYNMTRTNAGSWTYVQLKDRLGSVGYCRSSSLNQETVSNGSVLRYIPANGWVRVNIGAMIQGSTNFSSSFTGTNLRGSSNFMVEFISSASET
jgi:hypothetical protein